MKAIINGVYNNNYPPLINSEEDPSLAEYLPDMVKVQRIATKQPERLSGSAAKTVRCICLNTGMIPDMIQCQIKGCGIWQHVGCVGQRSRTLFACETCRFFLADPFLKTIENLLPMAKLKDIPGMPPIRDMRGNYHARISLEQSFFLPPQLFHACQGSQAKRRVTISCMKLEDDIYTRMHWPKNLSLCVNNLNVKPYTRGPSTELGVNQRDSSVDVTRLVVNGHNYLRVTAVDNGTWVVRISISEKQTADVVKSMMKRSETLEEAKKRMQRQLAGDSDHVVGLERMSFSLKDPLTCTRIKHPARFEDASGPQPFELDSYLSMVELNRKWQDPTTLKNSDVHKLQFDVYSEKILNCLAGVRRITRIEVNAEGDWRPEGYDKEWLDVCKDLSKDTLESIAAFAESGLEDSENDDETEEYEGAAGIDIKTEMVEAMSTLITLRKDSPRHVQAPAVQKRKPDVEVIELLSSDDD